MVIAAQCLWVEQKEAKQRKAVVLLLSLSLAGEAEVPSHQEEGGRAVGCRCCQSKPRQFGHILFTMATPAIHLLLGQSKHPAKQTNKHKIKAKPQTNQNENKGKIGVRAESKGKTSTWINMFSDVFCKHCMQKQIRKQNPKTACVWSQPKKQTKQKKVDTQTFLQHAPPTPVSPGGKPPNAHPTDPHDNEPIPHQPSHRGSNKCLGCFWFLFGYPECSSLTCGPRVRRRWCCGSGKRPWLTGPSAL